MATFGKFETVRELSSFHGADVYVARQNGESPPRDYVVKVFALNHSFGDDEQTKTDLQPLVSDLNRTFTQRISVQKMAAANSPRVAPIIDSGSDNQGPWYATRFYPRTLQKMILGKVNLSPDCILHIIRAVTEGAIALRMAGGRSHGNLKPANVLLGASAKITSAEVVVTDPMPGEISSAADFEVADLQAIGRIIYQLVRRRELADAEQWMTLPIQMSREWTDTFGKDAQAWLDLCNRLLECRSLDFYSLDRLASDLKGLQPKAVLSPALIVGAVVLVVAAMGVAFGMRGRKAAPAAAPAAQGPKPARTNAPPRRVFYGAVVLNSEPSGAHVIVDDQEVGVTPFKTNQVVGDEVHYELDMKDPNYKLKSKDITVHTNGETVNIIIVMEVKQHNRKGTVVFECTPFIRDVTSQVWRVNGKALTMVWPSDAEPMPEMGTETDLAPGEYVFRSKYDGGYVEWPEQESKFTVLEDHATHVTNDFRHGTVIIDSDPEGASVWLGTRKLGETPLPRISRYWPPGRLTLRFEKDQFDTTNVTVTVREGGTNDVAPHMVNSSGVVILTTDPAGAEIFDGNGQSRGRTGADGALAPLALTAGPNRFVARYAGLDDLATNVLVQKGQTTRYALNLNYAKVILQVDPPTAKVTWPFGTITGNSNYLFYQKPGAAVRYNVTAPGLVTSNLVATVASGTQTYSVRLSPPQAADTGPNKNLFGIDLVQLKPDFWVGKYDVTQWQYQQTMGNNPSTFHTSSNLPVDSVSWNDAQAFCQRLTESNRLSGQFHTNLVFRLPTRAEWENTIALEEASNPPRDTNSVVYKRTEPAPVGSLKPDARGLYDVRGNVWQWLQDSTSPPQAQQAGSGFDSSYLSKPPLCYRSGDPGVGTPNGGFRVVLAAAH